MSPIRCIMGITRWDTAWLRCWLLEMQRAQPKTGQWLCQKWINSKSMVKWKTKSQSADMARAYSLWVISIDSNGNHLLQWHHDHHFGTHKPCIVCHLGPHLWIHEESLPREFSTVGLGIKPSNLHQPDLGTTFLKRSKLCRASCLISDEHMKWQNCEWLGRIISFIWPSIWYPSK